MSVPRSCLICGRPCQGSRCPAHQQEYDQRQMARLRLLGARPRQERGYDGEYERNRRLMIERAKALGSPCVLCGQAFDPGETITAEHLVPLSQGGTSDLDNLAPAHLSCNRSRRGRRIETR